MKLCRGNTDGGAEFWLCQQSPLLEVPPMLVKSLSPQKKSEALRQQFTHLLLGGLEEALKFGFAFDPLL